MSLTVNGDPEEVAELFELAAIQLQRTEVPQYEMVIGSIRLQLVAVRNQFIGQCTGVGDDLFSVCLPGGLAGLQQSGSDTSDSLRKFLSDNRSIKRR